MTGSTMPDSRMIEPGIVVVIDPPYGTGGTLSAAGQQLRKDSETKLKDCLSMLSGTCGGYSMTMSNTLAKPILFVDIDGVLNPFAGPCPEGFREVDLLPDDDEPVRICPLHAAWLTELTVSFDLVWATSWNAHERELLKQVLDYPPFAGAAAMPSSPFPPENKVDGVSKIAAKRAVAWIDDLVTDRARIWAASRTEPTILLEADPRTGMTRKHVDKLLAWASALSE